MPWPTPCLEESSDPTETICPGIPMWFTHFDLQVRSSLSKRRWPRAHPTCSAQMYSCSRTDPSRSDHRFVPMSLQLIKMQLLTSTWKKTLEMCQDRGPKKKVPPISYHEGFKFSCRPQQKNKKCDAAGGRNQKTTAKTKFCCAH